MAFELKQQLRLSQQLVMTPQLQQAIKLLQLNRLELLNLVQQELQENPVLEESEGEEETQAEREDASPEELDEAEEPGAQAEDEPLDRSISADEEREYGLNQEAATVEADLQAGQDEKAPSDAETIADVEWESYLESNPMTGLESRGLADDDRPSLEATYARRPSLAEHLEWQLRVTDLTPRGMEIANWIIGNLDTRGFLRSTIEELALQASVDEAEVEVVLKVIQGLDPIGVAARDLRECLLRQLDAKAINDPLLHQIVDGHLDLLQRRDFRTLVRRTGATLQEVAAAAKVIGGLEPRPGRGFGGDDPVYVTPDIYVYKVGDEFHVMLNEDGLPKLRVNSMYREVLSGTGKLETETRDYVQEKVRSAIWLIRSIHRRQRTIYKVMQSIIRFQLAFFEQGVSRLKPLNLRDVADDIEMHESTVSRVTTNKYVHTPQGLYELKYFFNSSIGRSDGGEALASESVKQKIGRLIADEDRRRPLSDQRIAEILKSAKIDIARRTVTKYREAMNILSSTKRRQLF